MKGARLLPAALTAAGMLTLAPPPVAAEEAECAGATTQIEMNVCADQQFKAADAALNAIWPRARAAADAAGAGEALLAAQRRWVAFRDAACTAEAAPHDGGSIEPLVRLECLARLTKRRTEDLAIFLR